MNGEGCDSPIGSVIGNDDIAASTADKPDPLSTSQQPFSDTTGRRERTYEKAAGEPEEGRQEGKGHSRLPALTGALLGDVAPREDASTVKGTDEVHQQGEGNHPEHEQGEVNGVVDEGGGERDQPEERHEDGHGGDDLGEDEARFGP